MSARMEKGIKYSQDQSSIILLFEHNFRHNAVVLRVTLISIMLKSLFENNVSYPTSRLLHSLKRCNCQGTEAKCKAICFY